MSFRAPLILGLLLGAVLSMLALAARAPLMRWAADQWHARIARAPDESAGTLAAELARFEEAGIEQLVAAVGSQREPVAAAAEQAIWNKFEAWEELGPEAAQARLAGLAEALSAHVERFDARGRRAAARLADEILRWLPGRSSNRRLRIVAHCDHVLETAWSEPLDGPESEGPPTTAETTEDDAGQGPEMGTRRSTASLPTARGSRAGREPTASNGETGPGSAPLEVDPLDVDPLDVDPTEVLPPLAGGELPIQSLDELLDRQSGGLIPLVSDRRGSGSPGNRHPRKFPPPDGHPRAPDSREWSDGTDPAEDHPPGRIEPGTLEPGINRAPRNVRPLRSDADTSSTNQPRLPRGPREELEQLPAEPTSLERTDAADSPAGTATEMDHQMRRLEPVPLMQCLRAEDPRTARRAERELVRRGFTPVQLELAGRLTHPDPATRIELARMLPRLTTVNPVPWLLWLSEDKHPEVRLAAVSLMATTGDPDLLDRVEQLAREDRDAAVQRVAEQLSAKRR